VSNSTLSLRHSPLFKDSLDVYLNLAVIVTNVSELSKQ